MCLGHKGTLQIPSGWLSHPAGELVCFVPVASPWSADFIGILLVRVLFFSPAATGRSQDSAWIWLQSASSLCRARTIIICGLLAVRAFIVVYVCTLPLLAALHLPVPPRAPAASHEGSDWVSQLRQTGDRKTHRGTPEQVSSVPGNAMRH